MNSRHCIHLPLPPSTNSLWRQGKKGIVYRSKAYNDWTAQADLVQLTVKRGPYQMLEGPFICLLELHANGRQRHSDADNRLKAALDYAARLGLIEDDKLAQWNICGWVDDPSQAPPYGCRMTLMSWNKKEGLPEMTALIAKFGT